MLTYREYGMQRATAKARKIEFNLTFEQWEAWWHGTGHADERGKGASKYVMARLNDAGAYELGNIKCITGHDNVKESHLVYPSSTRGKLGWMRRRAKLGVSTNILQPS